MAFFPSFKYSKLLLYIIKPFSHLDNQAIKQLSHQFYHIFQQKVKAQAIAKIGATTRAIAVI